MKRILTFLVAITLLFSFQTANANEPCVACQTVSSFKVGSTTSTTASIYWNGVQGAKSYDVTVSQALPIPLVAITFEFKGITTSTLSVTKLTAGTTYTFTIKTNCTDGSTSELSKLGEFVTQKDNTGGGGGTSTGCGTVKDFNASQIDTTSASLKWAPVSGALSYEIAVTGANGFKASYTSTNPSVILNKLPGTGTYTYTIVVVCKDGKGEASKASSFTIKKTTTGGGGNTGGCGVTTDFAAFVLDSTSASIKWTAVTGALSYEIVVTGPKGFKATYTSTGNAVVANKLPGTGGYTYQIKAICKDGAGNFTKPGNFTITKNTIPNTTGCGQVAEVKVATTADTTSAKAYWSIVPGAVSYEISVTGANGFTQSYTSTTPNVSIVKLPGTGTYTVKVRAICKAGTGDWSKNKDFKITKPVTPPTPNNCGSVQAIKATATDSTTALIVWLPNFSATSYEITITSAAGFSLTLTSTTTPLTVTKLPSNTTFTVKIRAICKTGTSEWSKGTEFKTGKGTVITPNTSCGTPSGLSVKTYNKTTVQLNWKSVTNAISYEIEVIENGAVGTTPIAVNYTSKINTIIIDNLKTGSTYQFRVRSVCSTSTGEWSKYSTFVLKGNFTNGGGNNSTGTKGPNFTEEATSNRAVVPTNQVLENNDLIRSLYPNPASNGDVTITLNGKDGEGKLFIVNMLGSTVKTLDINAGETRTLEIGDLSAGYYFVKVKIGDRTETKRLMVARP